MKRHVLLTAILGLVCGATLYMGAAQATPTVTATATCGGRNNKWVQVTVDAPADSVIVVNGIQRQPRFVPDTGGSNPAGDYNQTLRIELWDTPTIEGHEVLATGQVVTPACTTAKLVTTAR